MSDDVTIMLHVLLYVGGKACASRINEASIPCQNWDKHFTDFFKHCYVVLYHPTFPRRK